MDIMEENYESYDQSIARSILPLRSTSSDSEHDLSFASSWMSRNKELEWNDPNAINKDEQQYAIRQIHKGEDYSFINGYEWSEIYSIDGKNSEYRIKSINGICATNTIRYDLLNAIKEFDVKYIITSSKYLNPRGVKVFRCNYIDKNTHYLVPNGMTEKDAEMIVREDIHEKVYNIQYRENWYDHYLYDVIDIEVYNPDFFVKVCRRWWSIPEYLPKLTLVINKKGVLDLDTVKGCAYGLKAHPDGGCYGLCYACKVATRYKYDFTNPMTYLGTCGDCPELCGISFFDENL